MIAPFECELPSSWIWRGAASYSMDIKRYATLALGMRGNQVSGDIDRSFATVAAGQLALATSIPQSRLIAMTIPTFAFSSVWEKARRKFDGQVYVCPDCLRGGQAYASKAWRTKLGFVCPKHGRYLIGNCPDCGEVIRHRVFCEHGEGCHWLDAWPYCPACGAIARSSERASSTSIHFATEWDQELLRLERAPHLEMQDHWRLAVRMWTYCFSAPGVVECLVSELGLPHGVNVRAACACAVMHAFDCHRYAVSDSPGRELMRALVGFPTDPRLFCAAVVGAAAQFHS